MSDNKVQNSDVNARKNLGDRRPIQQWGRPGTVPYSDRLTETYL